MPDEDTSHTCQGREKRWWDGQSTVRKCCGGVGAEYGGGSPYAEAPRPDLIFIFLDLNLPRVDVREVHAFVKGDESLRRIPLVILTTSPRAMISLPPPS